MFGDAGRPIFAGMAVDADAAGGTALSASGLDKGQGGLSSQLEAP